MSNRIAVLFGTDENSKNKSGKAPVSKTVDRPVSKLAQRFVPPKDFRGRDTLYRHIRQELCNEFPLATFTQQAEIDGLAQDYLLAADYRRMLEEAARPPLGLTADQERDWERCKYAERVWPVVRKILFQKEIPPQPMCTPAEASEVASEINRGIQLLHWRLDIEPETDGESESNDVGDPALNIPFESPEVPSPLPPSNPMTVEAIRESDDEDREFLRKLGNLVGVMQDEVYVAALLSGTKTPTATEWDAIQQVLEAERGMISSRTEPGGSLKYALQRVKDAAAVALVANRDDIILLEHKLRKTEEAIAKKLRRLRKC